MAAPTSTRTRRTAPSDWTRETYADVLREGLSLYQPGRLDIMLGPYAKDAAHVSSNSFVRCLPLLEKLIASNKDAIVHGARFEAACHIVMGDFRYLIADQSVIATEAHMFTNHIMAVLKQVRQLQSEESKKSDEKWSRQYPKTGALRRRLSASDWDRTKLLLSRMDDHAKPAQTLAPASLPPSASVSSGLPECFKPTVTLPGCFKPSLPDCFSPEPTCTPSQRRRKHLTLRARKAMPKAMPKAKAKAKSHPGPQKNVQRQDAEQETLLQ